MPARPQRTASVLCAASRLDVQERLNVQSLSDDYQTDRIGRMLHKKCLQKARVAHKLHRSLIYGNGAFDGDSILDSDGNRGIHNLYRDIVATKDTVCDFFEVLHDGFHERLEVA